MFIAVDEDGLSALQYPQGFGTILQIATEPERTLGQMAEITERYFALHPERISSHLLVFVLAPPAPPSGT